MRRALRAASGDPGGHRHHDRASVVRHDGHCGRACRARLVRRQEALRAGAGIDRDRPPAGGGFPARSGGDAPADEARCPAPAAVRHETTVAVRPAGVAGDAPDAGEERRPEAVPSVPSGHHEVANVRRPVPTDAESRHTRDEAQPSGRAPRRSGRRSSSSNLRSRHSRPLAAGRRIRSAAEAAAPARGPAQDKGRIPDKRRNLPATASRRPKTSACVSSSLP